MKKKNNIFDVLLVLILLLLLIGSFVFVSRAAKEDNDLKVIAEEEHGFNDENYSVDFIWNFSRELIPEKLELGSNSDIQSKLDKYSSFINLAYKYKTLTYENKRTEYVNCDFAIYLGLQESISEEFSIYENIEIGVEISAPVIYSNSSSFFGLVFDSSSITEETSYTTYRIHNFPRNKDNINCIMIGLGDCINYSLKAINEFTFKPYVIYENNIYYSSNLKTYSVASMTKTYHDNEVVESFNLYNIFLQKGLIKEENEVLL